MLLFVQSRMFLDIAGLRKKPHHHASSLLIFAHEGSASRVEGKACYVINRCVFHISCPQKNSN